MMKTVKGRGRTAGRGLGGIGAAVGMALALSACSDRMLDTGLFGSITGQPSPVSDNPSPVRGLSGANTEYPNLGGVPPRPTDIRSEAERQSDLDRLVRDREEARKRLPTPAAVPPPSAVAQPPGRGG